MRSQQCKGIDRDAFVKFCPIPVSAFPMCVITFYPFYIFTLYRDSGAIEFSGSWKRLVKMMRTIFFSVIFWNAYVSSYKIDKWNQSKRQNDKNKLNKILIYEFSNRLFMQVGGPGTWPLHFPNVWPMWYQEDPAKRNTNDAHQLSRHGLQQ